MIISQVRFVNIIYLFKNLEVLCIYEFHRTPINSCDYLNNIVCHDGNDIKEDIRLQLIFLWCGYANAIES